MTAALRLVETRPTGHPTFRPSMRPTLVPTSCPTMRPISATAARPTEAPSTQRSATVHPRFQAAARQEAQTLLSVMRLNADFLRVLLNGAASATAIDTLEELQRGIDRLEQRFASSSPLLPPAR